MKKRSLSIALAILMLITLLPSTAAAAPANVWDGTVAKSYAGGTGTSSNPYQIATGAQLAYLAKMVNSGTNYLGKYFALTADIDLNNIEWTPIAATDGKSYKTYYFKGIFDGRKHTVERLTCTTICDSRPVGLFGNVSGEQKGEKISYGVIHNINLEQAVLKGFGGVGGICAIASQYVNIYDCSFNGSIEDAGADFLSGPVCGGIVGKSIQVSIKNCVSAGCVKGDVAGGICGRAGNKATVESCTNYAKVCGHSYSSGIAGTCGESSNISKCSNFGEISGSNSMAVAGSESGPIASGICGQLSGKSHVQLCYNAGSISGGSSGGIAEIVLNSGEVLNCYNVGSVNGKVKAGGISGDIFSSKDGVTIQNCYNSGNISGKLSGSVVGEIDERFGGLIISNCYYLSDTGSPVADGDSSGMIAKTYSELSCSAMVTLLGSDVWTRADGVNNGYPVLYYTSLWAKPEIVEADDSGLVPSTLIGTDLTRSITRGEFAAVAVALYEASDGKPITNAQNPFTDISGNANYIAILKAYSIGITNGTTSATFEPNASISREQLATMLCRAIKAAAWSDWTLATDANFQLDSSGVTPFADDSKISSFARPSVYYMVKKSVINGIGNNLFAPRNTTDAEAADGYANASREQALVTSLRAYKNT